MIEETHRFTFDSYRVSQEGDVVTLYYRLEWQGHTQEFIETFVFPEPLTRSSVIESLLRALHLACGISYYKTTLAPDIKHPYQMDSSEAKFWNTVYLKGLSELLYVNNIQPGNLGQFSRQSGKLNALTDDITWAEQAVVAISGGKDSAIARELLRDAGIESSGFVMGTGDSYGQAKEMANAMKTKLSMVQRNIDASLADFNKREGVLNGHVPVSAIYAIIGCIVATTKASRYVVFANEASASLPQTSNQGQDVNHQWSKSLEFEQMFQKFVQQHVSPNINYFSAIRQLSSIAVAKIFSQFPAYYEIFTSDNSVFKIDPTKRPANDRWSTESSKSLSSFILLAPWLDAETLIKVFGQDFLSLTTHERMLGRLLGKTGEPVLDCVGTPTELLVSLNLAFSQGKFTHSHLMQYARNHTYVYEGDWMNPFKQMLTPKAEHAMPEKVAPVLQQAILKRLAS